MTLKEAQIQVDLWIHKYGVRYFNELTNLAILVEETGEFASVVARIYGEQSFKENTGVDLHSNLEDELGDIFFVLICLANQMDIDLEEALIRNMNKKTSRDKNRHKDNPKLK